VVPVVFHQGPRNISTAFEDLFALPDELAAELLPFLPIYHTLSSNPELEKNAMSVAEKLKAEGRVEGLWIGQIQSLEEFLDLPVHSSESLEALRLAELKAMQERLHQEYEQRFKRH
jgi:hypothetical protein